MHSDCVRQFQSLRIQVEQGKCTRILAIDGQDSRNHPLSKHSASRANEGNVHQMVTKLDEQAPVPPPAYHRAPARQAGLLTDAVTLVTTLHVWPLCRIAVRLAHWRCPPPCLPDQEGPHVATVRRPLLLIALLPTPWWLSYQDVHDWVRVCRCASSQVRSGSYPAQGLGSRLITLLITFS
jgi:hypothetical protein